jgi:hypothetical protein
VSSDAGFYEHLKASTAKLLGYDDVDHLTASQRIRVDRALALRLVIDDTQSRQMRGEVIDVRAFTLASEALERMVPGGNPDAPTAHDFSGAREELRRFFAQRADAIARRDAPAAEAIAAASSKTACGDAQSDKGVAHPPSSPDAPAGGGEPAVLIDPPPAPQQARRKTLEEINTPTFPPRGPRPAWRDYIGPDGEIRSPWFRPYG